MFDAPLQERERFQEMRIFRHIHARPSYSEGMRRALAAIQGDVNLLSPKAYESGLLLRLDPRLVNLYGEMPFL